MSCIYCDNTGYVMALSRQDPTLEYSFLCHVCDTGTMVGTRWSDSLKAEFIPVSFRTESYTAASRLKRAAETDRIRKRRMVVDAVANDIGSIASQVASQIMSGGFGE